MKPHFRHARHDISATPEEPSDPPTSHPAAPIPPPPPPTLPLSTFPPEPKGSGFSPLVPLPHFQPCFHCGSHHLNLPLLFGCLRRSGRVGAFLRLLISGTHSFDLGTRAPTVHFRRPTDIQNETCRSHECRRHSNRGHVPDCACLSCLIPI